MIQTLQDFHDKLTELANSRLAYVRANREKIVEAWLAETGLAPSEAILVERHNGDGSISFSVERKEAHESAEASAAALVSAGATIARLQAENARLRAIAEQDCTGCAGVRANGDCIDCMRAGSVTDRYRGNT